jgi:hypothetical protein
MCLLHEILLRLSPVLTITAGRGEVTSRSDQQSVQETATRLGAGGERAAITGHRATRRRDRVGDQRGSAISVGVGERRRIERVEIRWVAQCADAFSGR